MNIWFTLFLIVGAFEVGASAMKNGEEREGKHNAVATLIVWLLLFGLVHMAIKTGF